MFLRRPDSERPSDEDLLAQLRAGKRRAWGPLWDRYAHLLFGVAMKYLQDTERAKDLVMEFFADLPALAAKHEVRAFRPWVHAVVRNRCLMELRKKDPHAGLRNEAALADADTDEAVLREASLQALEAAINQLPEGQARCIRLFHLERKSYAEVAQMTGMPVEQVRSHLQNGRRKLRIILERHGTQH